MLKRLCLHLRRLVSYLRRQVRKREIPWGLLARQTTENNWKVENIWRGYYMCLPCLDPTLGVCLQPIFCCLSSYRQHQAALPKLNRPPLEGKS